MLYVIYKYCPFHFVEDFYVFLHGEQIWIWKELFLANLLVIVQYIVYLILNYALEINRSNQCLLCLQTTLEWKQEKTSCLSIPDVKKIIFKNKISYFLLYVKSSQYIFTYCSRHSGELFFELF